jgi:hypothetical protein
MKASLRVLSGICLLSVPVLSQEPEVQVAKAVPVTPTATKPAEPDDSPVPLPDIAHFERLWKDSMFTTKALPAPDIPAGPNFADNFTLSGTFEDRGKMTAILIDRTTSGIVQVFIGEDNEEGIRIAKIEPGDSPEKMRIQIQKGNQAGWVKFTDAGGDGGVTMQQPGQQVGQPGAPKNGPLATRPGRVVPPAQAVPQAPAIQNAPPGLQNVPRAEPVSSIPAVPATNMSGGMPQAPPTLPGDPPMPPQ